MFLLRSSGFLILLLLFQTSVAAAGITIATGDGQTAPINTRLPSALVVNVDCTGFLPGPGPGGICGTVNWISSNTGDSFSSNPTATVSTNPTPPPLTSTSTTTLTLSSTPGTRTVTATSSLLGSSVTFTITAVAPPLANNAQVTAVTGQPTPVNVQANSVTAPGHGTAVISNGKIIYTSANGFVGSDSFTYTVTNAGGSSTGTIQVTVQSSTLQNAGQTPNEQSVGTALSTINALGTASSALQRVINGLNQTLATPGGSEQVANALKSIAPEQNAAQINNSSRLSRIQVSNINQRLVELRGGATGISAKGLRISMNGKAVPNSLKPLAGATGGAAGDDAINVLLGRFGAFINGNFSFGNQITTDRQVGYNDNTKGLTTGIDYRLTDALVMGLAFGYGNTSTDFSAQAGKLENDGYSSSIYGSYYLTERLFLDSIFTYTVDNYNSERLINYQDAIGTVNEQAKSKPTGDQQRFMLAGGYDFNFGALTMGIRTKAQYSHMQVNQYSESGISGLNLAVNQQKNQSVLTELGGQLNYAISTSFGVVQPQLNFDWNHEYMNNTRDVISRFVGDSSGTAFMINTNTPDRDYFNLRPGISAVFPNGLSSFVNYETLLGYRYGTAHSVNAGVRLEF